MYKKKKYSTGSSKFVAFIAPLFRDFPIEIRGVENLIDANVCRLLMVRDKKGHGTKSAPFPLLFYFINSIPSFLRFQGLLRIQRYEPCAQRGCHSSSE